MRPVFRDELGKLLEEGVITHTFLKEDKLETFGLSFDKDVDLFHLMNLCDGETVANAYLNELWMTFDYSENGDYIPIILGNVENDSSGLSLKDVAEAPVTKIASATYTVPFNAIPYRREDDPRHILLKVDEEMKREVAGVEQTKGINGYHIQVSILAKLDVVTQTIVVSFSDDTLLVYEDPNGEPQRIPLSETPFSFIGYSLSAVSCK